LIHAIYGDRRREEREEREKAIRDLVEHTNLLKPSLTKLRASPLNPDSDTLFTHAKTHIESGYPHIWNILEGDDGIRKADQRYRELFMGIPQEIEDAVKKRIPDRPLWTYRASSLAKEIQRSITRKLTGKDVLRFGVDNDQKGRFVLLIGEELYSGSRIHPPDDLTQSENEQSLDNLNDIIEDALFMKKIGQMLEANKQFEEKTQISRRNGQAY
jgi:hypothetical protein